MYRYRSDRNDIKMTNAAISNLLPFKSNRISENKFTQIFRRCTLKNAAKILKKKQKKFLTFISSFFLKNFGAKTSIHMLYILENMKKLITCEVVYFKQRKKILFC